MGIQTALVVDDSRSARYILQRLLESRHIRVDVADSAQQAFAYLRTHRPDVVFMDDMMPDMDGNEAVERLGADPGTADIPIIMYTGRNSSDTVDPPRRGIIGVLGKPFTRSDVNALLAKLETVVPHERPQTARLVRLPEDGRADIGADTGASVLPAPGKTPPRVQSLDRLHAQLADGLKIEARMIVEQMLGEELEYRVDAQIERHAAVWRQSLEHVRMEQARANSQLLDERLLRLLELLEQRIDGLVRERLRQHTAELEQRLNGHAGADNLSPLQRAQVAHILHTEAASIIDRPARQSARRVAAELMRGDVHALNLRLDRLRRRFNSMVAAAAVMVIAAGVAGYLVK